MASKAVYGALMGLGQGISGYGKTLTVEELRKQEDARTTERQHSLQQIRQQYENGVRAETRRYNEDREMEGLDPSSEYGGALEAQRSRLAEEKHKQSMELVGERAKMYGGGSGKIMSQFNMSQWTPESGQLFMAEVQRLIEEEGMSPQEAQMVASSTVDLVPKVQSTASDTAGMNSSIDDEVGLFLSQPREMKIEALVELLGEEARPQLEAMEVRAMIELYKTNLYQIFARRRQDPTPSGLMSGAGGNDAPDPNDPLGLRK